MRRVCAYLTMDDMSDFVSDADLSIAPMNALGWDVQMVPWRTPDADWNAFDLVYICTPWDYPDDVDAFLEVLERIEQSRAKLVNSLELVRWNLEKTYLRELESRGAAIVPSLWYLRFDDFSLDEAFATHGCDALVAKPVVGANAVDTFVLRQTADSGATNVLKKAFEGRAFFVQPFIESVQSEGEYSVFFIGGRYSHAILKVPESGDFRTQEEHGAEILSIDPPDGLERAASDIVAMVEPQPVYVRADFVRGSDDGFLLMELELIEPSLYLRMNEDAAEQFARALAAEG